MTVQGRPDARGSSLCTRLSRGWRGRNASACESDRELQLQSRSFLVYGIFIETSL